MLNANSCSADSDWVRGKLLFGSGGKFIFLNLQTLKSSFVDEEEFALPPEVAKINNDEIIYTSQINRLTRLNVRTGARKELGSGSSPVYISTHNKYFFTDHLQNQYGPALFMADLNNPVATKTLVEKGPYRTTSNVVQVSNDQVVFDLASSGTAWSYDILTRALTALPLGHDCIPLLWRSSEKKLICFNLKSKGFSQNSLDGKSSSNLDGIKDSYPILYIDGFDVMIYGKSARKMLPPERTDLYVYRFSTGESRLLMEGVAIFAGQVAYFEE